MLLPLRCYSVMKLKESAAASLGQRICLTYLGRVSKFAAGTVAVFTENNFVAYCVILDVHLNYKGREKKSVMAHRIDWFCKINSLKIHKYTSIETQTDGQGSLHESGILL